MRYPIEKISSAEAKGLLAGQAVLIDVRSRQEYEAGHLPHSISFPLETIPSMYQEILPNYQIPLIVYCSSGSRSHIAAMFLHDFGYERVYDLGKMSNW